MYRTPVFIICSPRPLVGKTLIARLLTEFLLLKHGAVAAFDINLKEPSLLEFLPRVTETADVIDTFGKMQLMDRLIVNDLVGTVIDAQVLAAGRIDGFLKGRVTLQTAKRDSTIKPTSSASKPATSMARGKASNPSLIPLLMQIAAT